MTQEPDLLKMLAVAENAGEAWADGEHIDIFTPTRVRLLIERVVRAEQNFDEADSAKINAEGREENALSRAEKAERSCRLLGKIIERDGKNLVELTNSQDIIPEDGDGDWEVVWERAQEMKDRLEQAEQDRDAALEANKRWAHRSSRETSALRKANASIARVRALRNTWCDASYDPMNSGLSIAGTVNAIDRALDGEPNA